MTRTLILMRHAKSGYPPGVRDHDRPLADRGQREAALAGGWLRAELPQIDVVLCSTALRTQETVAAAALAAPVRLAGEIYEASPDEILEQIRSTAQDVRTLLVVGHAPGIPGLVLELTGDELGRFPTAAIAVLEHDEEWSELHSPSARLTAFHVPRE